MRKQKGFSLIELLIVVAIILIIAAIAIPNLMRSKMAANEASAVASTRSLVTAEATYISTYPNIGYAGTLTQLGPGSPVDDKAANLIDDVLAKANKGGTAKSGYTFDLAAVDDPNGGTVKVGFSVQTAPASASTGNRVFCTDHSGVIRYEIGPTAVCKLPDPITADATGASSALQ